MRRCRRGLQSPCQLQALLALLSITSALGLQQTIQLYRLALLTVLVPSFLCNSCDTAHSAWLRPPVVSTCHEADSENLNAGKARL